MTTQQVMPRISLRGGESCCNHLVTMYLSEKKCKRSEETELRKKNSSVALKTKQNKTKQQQKKPHTHKDQKVQFNTRECVTSRMLSYS